MEDPEKICRLEQRFHCTGFEDGQCGPCDSHINVKCRTENDLYCADCGGVSYPVGCFKPMEGTVRATFSPMATVSTALSALVLSDIVASCCL